MTKKPERTTYVTNAKATEAMLKEVDHGRLMAVASQIMLAFDLIKKVPIDPKLVTAWIDSLDAEQLGTLRRMADEKKTMEIVDAFPIH